MVSSTQQLKRIRKRKERTRGKQNKRIRKKGTPKFPIHLEAAPPGSVVAGSGTGGG